MRTASPPNSRAGKMKEKDTEAVPGRAPASRAMKPDEAGEKLGRKCSGGADGLIQRYALISSGIVTNVIIGLPSATWMPPTGEAVVAIPDGTAAGVGYTYANAVFTAPVAPPPIRAQSQPAQAGAWSSIIARFLPPGALLDAMAELPPWPTDLLNAVQEAIRDPVRGRQVLAELSKMIRNEEFAARMHGPRMLANEAGSSQEAPSIHLNAFAPEPSASEFLSLLLDAAHTQRSVDETQYLVRQTNAKFFLMAAGTINSQPNESRARVINAVGLPLSVNPASASPAFVCPEDAWWHRISAEGCLLVGYMNGNFYSRKEFDDLSKSAFRVAMQVNDFLRRHPSQVDPIFFNVQREMSGFAVEMAKIANAIPPKKRSRPSKDKEKALIQDLARSFYDGFGREPSMTRGGPFERFVSTIIFEIGGIQRPDGWIIEKFPRRFTLVSSGGRKSK